MDVDPAYLEADRERLAEEGKMPMSGRRRRHLLRRSHHHHVARHFENDPVEAIRALKRLGLAVAMLTGDNRRTAEAITRQVGVDRVLAEVPPEDEAARLQGAIVTPEGEPVPVELLPARPPGEDEFACQLGMPRGRLAVGVTRRAARVKPGAGSRPAPRRDDPDPPRTSRRPSPSA